MMLTGGLMFVILLIVLILAIGLPVLLIIALLGGGAGLLRNLDRSGTGWSSNKVPLSAPPVQQIQPAAQARYCVHCGAGLQADWTHCPQCGAPVQNAQV